MSDEPKLPTADLAPTGRAKCMHCNGKIEKGSVRVGAERDPGEVQGYGGPVPGYLHPGCALAWAAPRWLPGADDFIARVRANTALPELPEPFGAADAAAREQAAAARAASTPPFGALTAARVLSLAKKVAASADGHKADRAMEKAGLGWGERNPFRWHIARHGLVPPAHPAMLSGLAESARFADSDAVFAVVPLLRGANGIGVLPGWTRDADALVLRAHQLDPARLAALAEGASTELRLGIGLVRGRLGESVDAADRAAILDGLAACEAKDYGLPRSYSARGAQLYLEQPGGEIDEVHALTRCFGTDDAWADALARHAKKAAFYGLARVEEGLVRLPLEALVDVLARAQLHSDAGLDDALERVVSARADDPAALAAAAVAMPKRGEVRELLIVAALGRMAEGAAPAGLEDEIAWREFAYSVAPWRKKATRCALYRRAALALGRSRALARVDGVIEREYDRTPALALLGVFFDDARFRKIIAADGGAGALSASAMAAVGAAGIPALVQALEEAKEAKAKAVIGRWIRAILACEGLAGRSFDPALDAHVSVDPEVSYWSEEERAALLGMLAGMSVQRRVATVDRLRAEGQWLERVLVAAAAVPDAALHARVAAAIVAGFGAIKEQSELRRGLEALGQGGLEAFREPLIALRPDPKLFEILAAVFGAERVAELQRQSGVEKETKLARLHRLAAAATGPKERIYLLERADPDEGVPARRGRSMARGAGPAAPHDPDAEHVITLDLSEIPELGRRYPGAALLALFAPDIESGDGWDKAALFPVGADVAMPTDGEPITVVPVDVPSAVFNADLAHGDPALSELRELIFNRPGWALGQPMFIQEEEDGRGGFVMQLAEHIGGLNLGDSGSLYVYEWDSFMQCY